MYSFFLSLHSIIRWLVLLAGLLAAGRALVGWFGRKEWSSLDNRLGLFFMIGVDSQVLIGLVLYLFLSPITTNAFSDFGGAMSDSTTRFYLIEHVFTMVLSLVLVHLGRSLPKKVEASLKKHQRAAVGFGLAIIVIFLGIPWNRLG